MDEATWKSHMTALKTQHASLETQKAGVLARLSKLRSGKAQAKADKAKERVATQEGRVHSAREKYEAIVARNRAAGISPAPKKNAPPPDPKTRVAGLPSPGHKPTVSATDTGPKGGRFYTTATGAKVYVK